MTLNELLEKAEKKLENVHPVVAEKARQLITKAYNEGIYVVITQGYRSKEEQDALYAQGRTKPGKIVTNAKGGYSYHNFGLAFDFAIMKDDGNISWNVDDKWKRVAQIGKSLGLEWGGDWKSFPDYPHFQYTFGLSLADLRAGKRPPQVVKPTSAVEAVRSKPKYTSIVDYLKAHRMPYDFASRVKLAKKLGIPNYKGSAEQNIKMLELLQKQNKGR